MGGVSSPGGNRALMNGTYSSGYAAFLIYARTQLSSIALYWLCLSPAFNRHLFVTATGTKILHTSPSRIEDFTFRLPPTSTQKRIADVLDSLQEKIDLNEGMNQTLEEMAQSLYRHWFVDFTPLRGSAFDESDMGAIPAGWVAKPLDEVADFLNGVAWSRYKAKEGEDSLPVLKIRELRQGFDEQSNRVGPKLPEKYVIKDGDVIFSWSGTLLQKRWSGGTGALNQHLFKVTSNAYPEWFFYYGINHHIEEFRRIAANKATTMGHINRDHLSSALVAVPPSDVLEEVGQQLRPLFDMQLANDLEARSLVATRDYLLPKLLSGEVTVEEAEEEVEATV